jgi:hypothetical protein
MKYITQDGSGWDHRPYWRYLESAGCLMPAALLDFAANPHNHDLEHPNSLHDAWLRSWTIKEEFAQDIGKRRRVDIECCLLGPRHDRLIYLDYKRVTSHKILNTDAGKAYMEARGHGDLIVHEVIALENGSFSHELLFESCHTFVVEFIDFETQVQILPTTHKLQ